MPLFNFFGGRKKTLKDLSVDDLRRERITIDQEQRRLDKEGDRMARDADQLLSEYKAAGSAMQKKNVARKLRTVELEQKALDGKSAFCQKNREAITHLLLIKDRMEFFDRLGVGRLLNQMDIGDVESMVSKAIVDGELQEEKLATMLERLGDATEQLTSSEDGDLDDYMTQLDQRVSEGSATESNKDAPAMPDAEVDRSFQAMRDAARDIQQRNALPDEER